jgi:hypothetical protein
VEFLMLEVRLRFGTRDEDAIQAGHYRFWFNEKMCDAHLRIGTAEELRNVITTSKSLSVTQCIAAPEEVIKLWKWRIGFGDVMSEILVSLISSVADALRTARIIWALDEPLELKLDNKAVMESECGNEMAFELCRTFVDTMEIKKKALIRTRWPLRSSQSSWAQ